MSLNHSQYEAIMQDYEHTRTANRLLLEQRKEQVYKLLPEYEALEHSIASTAVRLTRLMLSEEKESLDSLRNSIKDISKQKKKLLTDAGFPEDYLEPIYTCSDCKDTGYIRNEDGTSEKCKCFRKQALSYLYDQSNIRNMIEKENFSTLSYQYYEGDDLTRFQKAVKICKDFVQNFEQDYHNLFFYGTVGTGKSFLSGCIAHALLQKECSVIYFSASALFDTLAQHYFDSKQKEALTDFCNDLYNCDLLIVDDLGTEITNNFVASQLFVCLNERHLRQHSTIISSNLGLEDLRDRYSDRVFSRITSNFALCKLTGPDIRMYKKRAANTPNS